MKLPFIPIARRDLKFVNGNVRMDVVLALSAPYRPAKTPANGPVGCMIIDCDDPAFAKEITGRDEMEVLQFALIHFDEVVDRLLKGQVGELRNADGSAFSQQEVTLFATYLAKANRP